MSVPNRLAKDPQDYERFGIRPSLIQPWEDGRRTDGSPGDWEWWYFDAQLDDGAKLIVVFQTKELAEINKPLTPTIRIDLTLPNGRQIDKLVELDPATFSASRALRRPHRREHVQRRPPHLHHPRKGRRDPTR